MHTRKLILSALAGVVLLLGGALLFWYEFSHFRIDISDEQLSDAGIALKGSMGQATFAAQQNGFSSREVITDKQGLDALLTASGPHTGEGLIEAYRRNPQEFRRYAELFDTAVNARRVGEAVLRLPPSRPPSNSSQLTMDSHSRVDAWGNPFCIIPLTGKLAVVSGGRAKTPCNALPLSVDQLNKSERAIFAGPSDSVVVILSKE
jgi:hypothetical protein